MPYLVTIFVDDKEIVLSREDCFKKPIACGIMFRSKDLENIGFVWMVI